MLVTMSSLIRSASAFAPTIRSALPLFTFLDQEFASSNCVYNNSNKKNKRGPFARITRNYCSSETLEKSVLDEQLALKTEDVVGINRGGSQSFVVANDNEFIKPDLDTRAYRTVVLSNNLEVLLVSDPDTDIESASVHVKAGHFDDPQSRAGLAHFHEHMLFLGTEKYPIENDFESFLAKMGGTSNAYTDMEDTNYYFNVAPLDNENDEENEEIEMTNGEESLSDGEKVSVALNGALDRFAQFFVSPLFNIESVENELRYVRHHRTITLDYYLFTDMFRTL